MAYVTPIYGGSAAQVDYRLGVVQHGCESDAQFRYHADGRERPLRWIGDGLAEFGVDGLVAGAELTTDRFDAARALLAGLHPVTGEVLVAPKVAVAADAKVSLGPLVDAVRALAVEREVESGALFGSAKQRTAWSTAVRAVVRLGEAAVLRVDDALALADAAGVDAERVWPGVDLVATYANLFEPKVSVDANGKPTVELVPRRVSVGIAGFDIGITVPKSTSLLLAFLPEEMAGRVEAGYAAAIERTFGWLEGRTSYVRRGKHGNGHTATHEATQGFAGWVMTHRAARPVGDAPVGDPHWHVHITVANMARAQDGTWLTVAAGGRDLMRHAPAIDKVTQAQVRAFLHDKYGITFARSARTGVREVAGIPDEAIVYFSKRGRQVSAVLEKLGYRNADVSAAEARVLTRSSRSGKTETTSAADATLRELWRTDAIRGAGLDPDALVDGVLSASASPGEDVDDLVGRRFGIRRDELVAALTDPEHGLTANGRRFSHLDAIAAVADALPFGGEIDDIEHLTAWALSHPAFVALDGEAQLVGGVGERGQLAGAQLMSGGQLFTTREVTEVEQTILDAVTAAPDRARVEGATAGLAVAVVEAAQGFALSAEQRSVLVDVVTSGRAVEVIEGPPGTGKTTLMRAARTAWEAAGYRVAGAATAAVAAQNLAAESGIQARTVAQWLWRIDHGDGLAGVDVLVLDEANLTSDRDRARLYVAAAEHGTKVVEVGDARQLRGVGLGSMFGHLHQLVEGPRLTENRRQRSVDERAALAAFRDGRHVEALRRWADAGGVVATETSEDAVAGMVATWLRLRDGAPDPHTLLAGLVMLAATNEQVARINDATQAVRLARSELGAGATYRLPGGSTARFHAGDLVLIRRNDRHQQAVRGDTVLNGYRGVVTAVTAAGVHVAWRDPTAEPDAALSTAVLSRGYIARGGLDLGYALTAHKAEGLTVGAQWTRSDGSHNEGSVLVYAAGLDNPGLYVSMSRDKGQVVLFGARAELEGERDDLVYGPPRDQHELTDRVITALAERATATAGNANDRPTLVDLGRAPAGTPDRRSRHEKNLRKIRELGWDLAWRTRPHGKLTDPELDRAIQNADRLAAREAAAAEDVRPRLAHLERAVAAEQGPRVTELGVALERLRSNARLQRTIEELDTQRQHADLRAAQAAGRASANESAADQTRWWQAGKRDQLLNAAATDRSQAAQAIADADALAARITELQQALGDAGTRWTARRDAERAEATYPRDREQALYADRQDVAYLHRSVTQHASAVATANALHNQLRDERQLRAEMPETRRDFEESLRTQEHQQELMSPEAPQPSQIRENRHALSELDYEERNLRQQPERNGLSLGR